jgi:hypothetical protein
MALRNAACVPRRRAIDLLASTMVKICPCWKTNSRAAPGIDEMPAPPSAGIDQRALRGADRRRRSGF